MSDETKPAPPLDERASTRDRPRIRPYKKALLVGSIACMVLGLVLQAVIALAGPSAPTGDGAGAVDPMLTPGFAATENGEPAPTPAEEDGLAAWSPAIFRLGFSFFAGFSMAYAARTFLRIAILVCGLVLLALFGLQYAGVIDVNWEAMSGHYDRIVAWLGTQTASFGAFVRGYLPSAATGTFGAVLGFRRG